MKILYITGNFRALTHTFMTREVQKVRDAGDEVQLLALRDGTAEPQTEHPECDLNGCRHIYPVSPVRAFFSALGCLVTRPGRFLGAMRAALSDGADSARKKAKLMYELAVATTLVRWVEEIGIEHIHAHLASSPTTYAMYLALLTGRSFSFTGHAADVYRGRIALKPKLRLAAGVVCISEYNRRHYLSLVPGLKEAPIIHCGIRLEDFPRRAKTAPDADPTVFAVGRCVPKKGFADLLQTVRLLADRNLAVQVRIAGDGPLLPQLQDQAADLGIAGRVEFLGSVPQATIRAELERADLFALPSVPVDDGDIDGIPVSLMEAMAVGCPVISTRVSGIPELVVDGESGLLVPPRDPQALAAAIERLATDPELYRELGDGGRGMIEREFDLTAIGQRLSQWFAQISRG